MTFEQALAHFKAVTAQELEALIQTETKVVAFIGRATCPYCQRFAPKLAQAQEETGETVYFVDSSNPFDGAVNALRDKYRVVTVPGFLVARAGQVDVVCDSSISVADIKALMA